jgi:hypothetical protein
MLKLNKTFLADVGLDSLPEDEKQSFLQHIYDELELRVGTVLSTGMTNEQLDEFESIIDKDDLKVKAWLLKYSPDYYNDEDFLKLEKSTGLDVNDPKLRAEYAANLWFKKHRPDYQDIVKSTFEELKKEIIENKDKILG